MELQLAKGVRDFLPEEKIVRQELMDILRKVFELYGFNPLETPAIERFEVLSSKFAGGAEILKETFKFKDQGERELALRYYLTVPFARVIAMNPQLKMPWKRYQMDKVWRDGPIKIGRYREFWQCDVDIVGCRVMSAEAEIISMAADIFERFNMDVDLAVNNIKLLKGLVRQAGIKEDEDSVILSLDKLKKIGVDGVKKELSGKGVDSKVADTILDMISIKGSNADCIKKIKALCEDELAKEGIQEIEDLFDLLKPYKLKTVKFDVSLARGLSYYTGTVFEGFLTKSELKSSVCGGRYDNMIGDFLGKGQEYPAVGISFGLEPIFDSLKLDKRIATKKSVAKLYIIPFKNIKEATVILQNLRKEDINCEIDIVGKNVSKNLDYADKMGIPFVLFAGDQELKEGKFKLRDMGSGDEQMLSEKDLITFLK